MFNSTPICEVMLKLDQFPHLSPKALVVDALERMSYYRLGIACAVDEQKKLVGVFTDGDLRRLLLKQQKPLPSLMADDLLRYLSQNAQTILPQASIQEAIFKMEEFQIWDLPVVEKDGELCGLLHLHPVVNYLLGVNSRSDQA